MTDFLTPDDVAKSLQVSRLTVYRWAASGRLPSFKIGRAVRFAPEALELFVARQSAADTPAYGLRVAPGRPGRLERDPDASAVLELLRSLRDAGVAARTIRNALGLLHPDAQDPSEQTGEPPTSDPDELVMRAYRDAARSTGQRRVAMLQLRAHCPLETDALRAALQRLRSQQQLQTLTWTSHERLSLEEHKAGLELDAGTVYWVKDGDRIWLRELGASSSDEEIEVGASTDEPRPSAASEAG